MPQGPGVRQTASELRGISGTQAPPNCCLGAKDPGPESCRADEGDRTAVCWVLPPARHLPPIMMREDTKKLCSGLFQEAGHRLPKNDPHLCRLAASSSPVTEAQDCSRPRTWPTMLFFSSESPEAGQKCMDTTTLDSASVPNIRLGHFVEIRRYFPF